MLMLLWHAAGMLMHLWHDQGDIVQMRPVLCAFSRRTSHPTTAGRARTATASS